MKTDNTDFGINQYGNFIFSTMFSYHFILFLYVLIIMYNINGSKHNIVFLFLLLLRITNGIFTFSMKFLLLLILVI